MRPTLAQPRTHARRDTALGDCHSLAMLGRGSGEWGLVPWLARSEAMQQPASFDVAWDEDEPESLVLVDARGRGTELQLSARESTVLRWAVMTDQGGTA